MKPEVSVKYPHMMPEDTRIWRRCVALKMLPFDQVWYDVRVGQAVPVPNGQPDWMRKMAGYSCRKRIDIVGRQGLDYWVVEAKPGAGVVALGQALVYTMLFDMDYRHAGAVWPLVLTDRVDVDVGPLMGRLGVDVREVGLEADGWES